MTPTLTLSKAIARLEHMKAQYGDVPIVLWDLDTSVYFPLEDRCFEAQLMDDGSVRVSVGSEHGYGGNTMPWPVKRPL